MSKQSSNTKQDNLIGLKELRENMSEFIDRVQNGESFTVLKRSKPAFRIGPPHEDGHWETVADFTEVDEDGVSGREILRKIQKIDG